MENTNTRASTSGPAKVVTPRPYLMVIAGGRVGELHTLTRERTIIGRSPEAEIRLGDTGVSRAHAELFVEGGRVRVRDLGSTNGTFCNGERADGRELRDGDKLSIGAATLLLFTHQDGLEPAYQRGRFLAAVRDPATAALKRELFLERLGQEVSFSRRHAAPLSVLAWELDGFAALAERLGPELTSRCLAAVARAARTVLGDGDLLGVLGPGRFAVACRETDARAAAARASNLRAAIATTALDGDSDSDAVHAPLSASVGVAATAPGNGPSAAAVEALLRGATAALAVARTSGGVAVDAASLDDPR